MHHLGVCWRYCSCFASQVIAPGAPNVVVGHDGMDWLTYHSNDLSHGGLSRMLCVAPMTYPYSKPKVRSIIQRLRSRHSPAEGDWCC